MIPTIYKIGFGLTLLIFSALIIWMVLSIKRNKRLALSMKPTRFLSYYDFKAIDYLEVKSNLMFNLLVFKKIPKKKLFISIWRFSNVDVSISHVYKSKRIVHHFFLGINGVNIEVIVPDIFLPYLNSSGLYYKNETIEILYRQTHFTLYALEGIVSYPILYEKHLQDQKVIEETGLKRPATKKELAAFMFSKWSSVWGLMPPIIFPIMLIALMEEGPSLWIVFLPFFLIISIPLVKAYKKRKEYIASRLIHTLKGTIWFDEKNYLYRINDNELRLHRKWKRALKKVHLPLDNVEIEAVLHTYDNLNPGLCRKFQPIAITSTVLKINETTLKNTRSWGIPFLYAIACGALSIAGPQRDNIIVDIRKINVQMEGLVFKLIMTAIWWASIIASLYLAFIVLKRIKGHYFTNETY